MANTFNAITSGAGGIATTGDASGAFSFTKDGGTASVNIDASGNLLLNTTTPAGSAYLYIKGGVARDAINVAADTTGTAYFASFRTSAGTSLGGFASDSTQTNFNIAAYGASSPLTFSTNSTERMRIDSSGNLLFNSGYGSVATAYGCRAWVNFNGTGTVAIRGSGNVSSITDLGTGNYQVNFTTAMPDTNYATNYNLAESYGSGNYSYMGTVNNTTGYVQMYGRTGGTGAAADMANCMVSIHR